MRRKLSLLIAFVGVLGLVGFSPVAQAGHDIKGDTKDGPHETEPEPPEPDLTGGECVARGEVLIGNANNDGGVTVGEKNHNHYFFRDTGILCTEIPGGNDTTRFTTGDATGTFSEYNVFAAGGTDGPWQDPLNPGTGEHGEDDAQGWSHSSCYDDDGVLSNNGDHGCDSFGFNKGGSKTSFGDLYDGINENPEGSGKCFNCGEIEVECAAGSVENDGCKSSISGAEVNDGEGQSENWVKFTRVGSTVVAWGALHATSKTKDGALCFLAELEFIPTNQADNGKTVAANLEGSANIWTVNDKSECAGQKGEKKE